MTEKTFISNKAQFDPLKNYERQKPCWWKIRIFFTLKTHCRTKQRGNIKYEPAENRAYFQQIFKFYLFSDS